MHGFAELQSRTRKPNDARAAIEDYEAQANQSGRSDLLPTEGWQVNKRDRVTQAFDQRGAFSI